jgi:hypothetical protein
VTRSFKIRLMAFLAGVALSGSQAVGQATTQQAKLNTSWGYYQWQVDHGTLTTTLTTETGYTVAPPGGGYQIPVSIPAATTIHEVHGNVTFTVWSTSCGLGTIIADVKDQNGNFIAKVYMEDVTNTSDNIPIKGVFPAGLSITSLQLDTYNSQCGPVTLSWSLVMS